MREPDNPTTIKMESCLWLRLNLCLAFALIGLTILERKMNTPNDITKDCFDTLLAATAADNFEQFVSMGDDRFKNGLEPEVFHRVCRTLAPRLRKGCTPSFLGEMRQDGYTATLWRLRFNDEGDDLLFRMAIDGGKVLGALVGKTFGS
jgi:hypothetical protein